MMHTIKDSVQYRGLQNAKFSFRVAVEIGTVDFPKKDFTLWRVVVT
jgi:hypothetical protein